MIILIVAVCILILDQVGLWKDVILEVIGKDPFTHLFLVTFLIINGLFFSLGLLFTNFDLNNVGSNSLKKV